MSDSFHTRVGVDINEAAGFLKQGDLVAIPTETVYGLAGNALDETAVLKIFQLKNRPSFDPLIVHVTGIDQVESITHDIPLMAYRAMEHFWPGPLTLILPKKSVIPDLVTSGLDTVGVRMPNHPLTSALLSELPFPLAAPSANPFGYISPTTASHVLNHFDGRIPYILDGGPCKIGIESTIVGFDDGKCLVYRRGGISVEALKRVVGEVIISTGGNTVAPGMLKSHYAPRVPLYFGLWDELTSSHGTSKAKVICLSLTAGDKPESWEIIELSPEGNIDDAARRLFGVMREADQSGAECILAVPFPEEGLGIAINDRLLRASFRD
jgi:L-threonylcarbamoyladenylate synthase